MATRLGLTAGLLIALSMSQTRALGSNYALNGSSYQFDAYDDSCTLPSKGVDGSVLQDMNACQCVQTGSLSYLPYKPWWVVKLRRWVQVSSFRVIGSQTPNETRDAGFVQTLNKSLASGDYVLYRCVRHRKPLSTFPRPNAKACGCRAYVSFKYVPDGVWVSRSTEHQNHTIDHECYGLDHNKEKVVQKLNCIIKTLKSKDAIVSPDFLDGLRQLEYQCSHQICQLKSESDMTVTIE